MASALALVASLLFALAATLQQKGALNLPEISLRHPSSFVRLAAQTMWLAGTMAVLAGYVFQAAALDGGRLAIIQPLLVTTVVFALPLGYFLTSQTVGRREVIGSGVIVAPSVATVSVANPVVSILLGIALLDERLSRPAWHVAVACTGLALALVGAVLIALARQAGEKHEQPVASVATA